MRNLFLVLLLSVFAASAAFAQSRVVVGAEGEFGAFGLYDTKNARLGSGKSVGVYTEVAREFEAGTTKIVPKALLSVKNTMPDGGQSYISVGLRPEVEAHMALRGELKAIAGAGFQYTEGNRNHQFNPTISLGAKYYNIEATVARLFPDRNNGNARGWRYNGTYHIPNAITEGIGVRTAVELFKGRSEFIGYNPSHPGYAGYTLTFRLGASWDK